MGWLYLPGSVASNSDCTEPSPDTELSVTSSGTPTLRRLSWPGWERRSWVQLLSGTTYPPSTASRGLESWISSLAASRAKTSALREPEPVSTESGRVSGPSTRESFARYDPASFSWKTSQLSLLEDSTVSSATWPKAGTMRNGICSERSRSARRTAVKGSSYSRNEYPTPSATPYGTSQNEGQVAHKRPTAGTPSLETWAKNWPTAGANDWKGSYQPGQRRGQLDEAAEQKWATPTAGDAAGRQDRKTPKDGDTTSQRAVLNPQFVEALMGFPPGWSSAQIDSGASETESSPRSRNSRGER